MNLNCDEFEESGGGCFIQFTGSQGARITSFQNSTL